MSPEAISPQSRELLANLRNLLLAQHKLLLDRERASWEATNGPVGSPGQYLNLVIEVPHFAWLKQLSTLVVEIDEALARRSTANQAVAEALVSVARKLTLPDSGSDDFQRRYAEAIELSADVAALNVQLQALLAIPDPASPR